MKHCGGDLPRVHSECHSIPKSHVLRQKAPAHVKHRDMVLSSRWVSDFHSGTKKPVIPKKKVFVERDLKD